MSLFVAWFKANGVDPAEKHCLTDLASRDLMGQGWAIVSLGSFLLIAIVDCFCFCISLEPESWQMHWPIDIAQCILWIGWWTKLFVLLSHYMSLATATTACVWVSPVAQSQDPLAERPSLLAIPCQLWHPMWSSMTSRRKISVAQRTSTSSAGPGQFLCRIVLQVRKVRLDRQE